MQRLGIAQAQINYPDLLILDEPAASLDPQGRHDVLEVMERLRQHTTIFYSTYILSDVQRVSDTVAILNHGQLIAQSPIEELLASNQSSVYTLVFKGNASKVKECVSSQPWVKSLQATPTNGHVTWQVAVTDEAAAEAQLLRLVQLDSAVTVTEFGRKKVDLAQDEIIGEKRSGTAAWILSKPVSRSAFVLSKLLGNLPGIVAIQVLLGGALAALQTKRKGAGNEQEC